MLPEGTGESLGRARVVGGWVLAVAGTAALTAALIPFRSGSSPTYEAILFLGFAVACALVGGRWPAIAASLLGTLLLNYFFAPPLHTFSIARGQNVLTLVVFVVTSVAVASVVDSAARRRQQATLARAEANTLGMLNSTVLGGEYDVPQLLELVRRTFGADRAELVLGTEVGPADTAAQATKIGARDPQGSVLVLRGRSLDPSGRRILGAFASHVGVLRERDELARQTEAARELEAGNRTRTALLAAVSHDLRTPLAGIKVAAETLRTTGQQLSGGERAELLEAIETSTDRLTAIVTDLLDMSRLQTGAVHPELRCIGLGEVALNVLAGLPGREKVRVDADLPDVLADVGLLERVVENVLANAIRYSDRVRISGVQHGARVQFRVTDHGPGVPDDLKLRMFEPFQRLSESPKGEGAGLGLAVARGLTEAQGGSIDVEDTPGGGLTMVIDLPAGGG
ncbi:MAG: putative two-component system sensor kinase [Marmoricola sp.]|nr:putative two-component system sensor kinase [Marmoricola sp.]